MDIGNITMWNDSIIQALNPVVTLPAIPIVRVVRIDVIPYVSSLSHLIINNFHSIDPLVVICAPPFV
jgi:hypothetical protein